MVPDSSGIGFSNSGKPLPEERPGAGLDIDLSDGFRLAGPTIDSFRVLLSIPGSFLRDHPSCRNRQTQSSHPKSDPAGFWKYSAFLGYAGSDAPVCATRHG